ncbi:MAG: hypothetical protein CSA62_06405 [Planctomycetota bacterium]|nr:MAG: hypothetical protein CSA62_06405 [Planctomycetota bacterium]
MHRDRLRLSVGGAETQTWDQSSRRSSSTYAKLVPEPDPIAPRKVEEGPEASRGLPERGRGQSKAQRRSPLPKGLAKGRTQEAPRLGAGWYSEAAREVALATYKRQAGFVREQEAASRRNLSQSGLRASAETVTIRRPNRD